MGKMFGQRAYVIPLCHAPSPFGDLVGAKALRQQWEGGLLGGWEMMVSIELGVQSTPVVDAN